MLGKKTKTRKEESEKVSRRQFLKSAGLIIGGAALGHLAVSSSCATSEAATTPVTTVTSSTPITTATTTPLTTATSSTQNTTTTPTTSVSSTTSQITNTETPTQSQTGSDTYTPPDERPPLSLTPNCTTYVAFDRLYCVEHIWVKDLGNNRAVMGITDKLQALMDSITQFSFPKAGDTFVAGTSFGNAEGFKMSVDLITPVSIEVIEVNHDLLANSMWLNNDPFVKGWILYVKLTQPEELSTLLTPQEYMDLQAKDAATAEH